jgi:hypothetical protein
MKLQHLVLKAGKSKSVEGHPIAYEMVDGEWHVLSYDGPNTDERTPAMGLTAEYIED